MPDPTSVPGWVALGVAGITAAAQGFVALVQRPREKKSETELTEERFARLTEYLDRELRAARMQFQALQRTSSSNVNVDLIEKSFSALEQKIDTLESNVNDLRTRFSAMDKEREEDRKAQQQIQLDLREVVTTMKLFLKMPGR